MNARWSIYTLILAFMTLIIGFGSSHSAQAQASTLPDGWCQQPSNVLYRVSDHWTDRIGVSEGGIRAVYQPYNQRIVLQSTEPREVVQVIEDGVALSRFEVLRYTANCRYLIAIIREPSLQYDVVVYDLQGTTPARLGSIVSTGRSRENVESSPEGTYLLVTTWDGLHLWNLATNTQTHLTPLVRSDCDFVGTVGCSGDLDTYREARWDVPHGLLQLDLITNYTFTLNLPAATIHHVEATPRYAYSVPTSSPDQLSAATAAYSSNYACQPRVQYQSYNRRIALIERYAHQLVGVVEDNLDLSGFQFLGWSATCTYFAAAIEDAGGLRLAAWNINDMTRREHPLTDWADSYSWETSGDTLNVRTDGGSFVWNLSDS